MGLTWALLTPGFPQQSAGLRGGKPGGPGLHPSPGSVPGSLGDPGHKLVWGCPYAQGPVPVSGCLLHAGASDVAQAAAEKTGTVSRTGGGEDAHCPRGRTPAHLPQPPASHVESQSSVSPRLTTHVFRSPRTKPQGEGLVRAAGDLARILTCPAGWQSRRQTA